MVKTYRPRLQVRYEDTFQIIEPMQEDPNGEWISFDDWNVLTTRLGAVRSRCEEVRDMSAVMERAELAEEILYLIATAVDNQEERDCRCGDFCEDGTFKSGIRCRRKAAAPDRKEKCGASFEDYMYGTSYCDLQQGHDEPHRQFRFGPDAVDRSTAPDRQEDKDK